MSTRSSIIIKDKDDQIQLYRHYDGYPEGRGGVLCQLRQAIEFAFPLPRYEATDFAAALVRAWKPEGGGHIYIYSSLKVPEDVEWIYIIEPGLMEPTVEVYRAGEVKPVRKMNLSEASQAGLNWE